MRGYWAIFVGCAFATAVYGASSCEALRTASLSGTTIDSAVSIAPYQRLVNDSEDSAKHDMAVCRVIGIIRPASDSEIRFEVWIPETSWNGRFLAAGNGGFAGTIEHDSMSRYIQRGYATANTDTGHQGEAVDASWAYQHPEKVTDFGYRAVHLMTVTAKALIAAYYGHGPARSYFDSCSNGGRQALMEAQRFPDDYDGILAGAPANNWTNMLASGVAMAQALYKSPASYISALKLPALHASVMMKCDAADGVRDGIINNPEACHFDPSAVLCKGTDQQSCLTEPQVKAAKTIYSGTARFPGLAAGSELGADGWTTWEVGEGPGRGLFTGFVENYFRYMVFEPAWNVLTADVEQSYRMAERKSGANLNAIDPDLRPFARRGGKLIIYHGWDDPAISPLNSVNYYESVVHKIGREAAAQVIRLYMVPGMQHCFGGPGPSALGQFGIATSAASRHGIFDALEAWIEHGTAPGSIVATKYAEGISGRVAMTRPICPYPQVPAYNGSGDTNEARNFHCQ